ncbi:MAG: methylmalonyl-CoA mutase family protein [Deltaproteobacteria bacterium]|nr:methylmalonyl-CoA mutase family protein [Deltaproteobacteria bacterium]
MVHRSKKGWERETRGPSLLRFPDRAASFTTTSDAPVEPLYTADDLAGFDPDLALGYPGEYPFTRGIHPTMYRGRLWTHRLFSGFGTPTETNARYKYLLKHGQTGLSVAFDFPTLMGYDADADRAIGEVGKCGVNISSLKDMEVLFDGIPLDRVTTSMTINGPAAVLLAFYLAAAQKQGVPLSRVGGTVQNDCFKEYIAQNSYAFPPRPSVRITVDMMAYCAKDVPLWNTISISGYHIREAGSTAVQELAFTLADGIGYVQAGIERGLPVDDFAPRLSFFFNAHNDFLEEIAKYRAARRMWATIMRERFHAQSPRSWMLRFHTQTAGCSLTAQQPYNNVVRTTIQALAAVLGGTQSLHTNALDETLALPTESSARIALRTQQIIAHESGVVNTIDPLAGSYCVESLTHQMEREASAYIDKIDAMGGIIAAIEAGYPQREIANAAFRYQQQIDQREKIIVGVNDYVTDDSETLQILRIGDEARAQQVERLASVRAARNPGQVAATRAALQSACASDANVMPRLLDCAHAYCTLGEIIETMKSVFGEYHDPGIF